MQRKSYVALDTFLVCSELGVQPSYRGLRRFRLQALSALRHEKMRRKLPRL